ACHHSSVLLNTGSMSKITPRNGYRRCLTTCPILNLAFRCLSIFQKIATAYTRSLPAYESHQHRYNRVLATPLATFCRFRESQKEGRVFAKTAGASPCRSISVPLI